MVEEGRGVVVMRAGILFLRRRVYEESFECGSPRTDLLGMLLTDASLFLLSCIMMPLLSFLHLSDCISHLVALGIYSLS